MEYIKKRGPKLKVSADLKAIIGKDEASRQECVKELWAYLKKNNLQDPENKQFFTPDKKMAKVFGTEKMRAFTMTKFLTAHLTKI
jgi:chromatin remodeling complex protein RSC6